MHLSCFRKLQWPLLTLEFISSDPSSVFEIIFMNINFHNISHFMLRLTTMLLIRKVDHEVQIEAVNFSKSGEASVVIPKMNITMAQLWCTYSSSAWNKQLVVSLSLTHKYDIVRSQIKCHVWLHTFLTLSHTNMIYFLGLKSSVHVWLHTFLRLHWLQHNNWLRKKRVYNCEALIMPQNDIELLIWTSQKSILGFEYGTELMYAQRTHYLTYWMPVGNLFYHYWVLNLCL